MWVDIDYPNFGGGLLDSSSKPNCLDSSSSFQRLDLERLISSIATNTLKLDRESMYQSDYMYIGPILSPILDHDVARLGLR